MNSETTRHKQQALAIAQHLRVMRHRTRKTEATCFLILSTRRHEPKSVKPIQWDRGCRDVQQGNPVLTVNANRDCLSRRQRLDLPASRRFVQFAFGYLRFMLDLPSTTISEQETDTLMRSGRGFVRNLEVVDRKGLAFTHRPPERLDPIDRPYDYGQELVAAHDAVFVLYYLWKLPQDTDIYLTAGAFDWHTRWENDWLLRSY